eukprot:s2492_g2.t1
MHKPEKGGHSGYHPFGVTSSPDLAQKALTALNAKIQAPLTLTTALTHSQKSLTTSIDDHSWGQQLLASPFVAQATLRSECEPGARAFLAAVPTGRKQMPTAVFVAELRHRPLVPEASKDVWRPRCDGVLDVHSYHAHSCVAGPERNLRHHAARDILCHWIDRAGLQPEKEKPELLLPQKPEDTHLARRRPADIFVPSYLGSPAALDLAVTAPQRQEVLGEAAQRHLAAASAYAHTKQIHLNTAQVCRSQGVDFCPLVAETAGHGRQMQRSS